MALRNARTSAYIDVSRRMTAVTFSDLGEIVKEKFMLPDGIAFRLDDVMAFQLCVTYTDQVGSRDNAFEFDSASTVIPRLTKIIRSGITFVSRNLR